MSNTFITPKVVSTIQQSRINYNTSLTSILTNFASAGEPAAGSITLEDASGLQTGMLWYKAGTDTSDGQGRMLVYNGSDFTRDGLSTYAMPSIAAANAAAVAGTIESGELVTVGTDRLYMVNQASTGIFDVGAAATTLSGLVATQFIRRDIDSNAQGNVSFTSNSFVRLPIGNTAQRPGTAVPGMIRFNSTDDTFEGYDGTVWAEIGAATFVDTGSYVYYTGGLNVGIGTATPASALQVVGTVTATDFDSLSDANLKTDIELIDNSLTKLSKISGVTFNFKDAQKRSAGVLAQEVEQVLPEAVSTDTQGIKSVSYSAVLALLIQAFKEYVEKTDDQIAKLKKATNG